ncbi:MAG: serine hydrolase [Candidatus Gottesmanbacteria bacterium]
MQDYGPNINPLQKKPAESHDIIVKIIFIAFMALSILGFFKRYSNKNQIIISPLPETIISFFTDKPKDSQSLILRIKEIIEPMAGTWAIYYYDLTTNQNFGINQTMIFNAASVNKIPILASLYYLADKGEINLEEKITLQKADIQDYGTGSIRYDPPGSTYSIKTLARLMMEKSDNTAAFILGRHVIGLDRIQQLIDSWGLSQTSMENDQSSLIDMITLLRKMYQGEITNQALTTEMIGFMDDSDFENRIPALLPIDIKIYHKTGDYVGGLHDVGIINLPDHPYIFGIFTSDINNQDIALKTMAQISKEVFDFSTQN